AFEHAHPDLRDLLAERRPRQRRVVVHDVAGRSVRRPSQDVRPGAVGARDRDERAPRVVLAARPQADAFKKAPQHVVHVAPAPVTRGHDQIFGLRHAAHVTLEAFELPRGEDLRERRMTGISRGLSVLVAFTFLSFDEYDFSTTSLPSGTAAASQSRHVTAT